MKAGDMPLHAVLHGPPVPPQPAARRLCDEKLGHGNYAPEALHAYTDESGTPLFWRIRVRLPDGSKWIRPMRRDGMIYAIGEPEFGGRGKPIYRMHEIVRADRSVAVWFTEGELCADSLARLGLVATTAGGANDDDRRDFEPLRGRHVIIWPDNDDPGRAHGERVAAKLLALGCRVEIVEIEPLGLPKGGDVIDYLRAHPGATAADLMALARRSAGECTSVMADAPHVELLCARDVKIEPVRWLWEGWLAAGKLHILAGAPGAGKTTLALAFAATITAGGRWPDGTRAEVGDVMVWSAEDGVGDTLVPRLAAMGADLSRVHFVGPVSDPDGPRPFDPARDVPLLREALRAKRVTPQLLVVDPIVAAIIGDSHKNAETRRSLQPLADLGAEIGCAIVGVTHFTKGTAGRDPVERVNGSLAFGAAARVVLAAAKLPDDQGGGRVLAKAKSNLGADGGGFRFNLEAVEVPGGAGAIATRIVWAERLDGTARDLLAAAEPPADGDRGAIEEAVAFLTEELAAGPVLARDIRRSADGAGLAWRTVQEASRRLGVDRRKVGMAGGWVWALPPKMQGAPKMHEDASIQSLHLHAPSAGFASSAADDGLAAGDRELLDRARRVLGWSQADCQGWTADMAADADRARRQLRALLEFAAGGGHA